MNEIWYSSEIYIIKKFFGIKYIIWCVVIQGGLKHRGTFHCDQLYCIRVYQSQPLPQ